MGKKKGASDRLAKMSDDEKARYLLRRAEVEEEARRRKQELVATYLKNKLKREEVFARINLAKINQEWRQLLRRVKIKELKDDLEAMWHWIEHTLAAKNSTISCLMSDLDESEEQYGRNFEKHLTCVEKLIGIHKQWLGELHGWYEEQRNTLVDQANREEQEAIESAARHQNHLQMALYRMETDSKETRDKQRERYIDLMNDEMSTMKIRQDEFIADRENQIGALWKEINSVLANYLEQTDVRRRQYANMKSIDEEDSVCITQHYETINKQLGTIEKLKENFMSLKKERGSEIESLKSRYDKIKTDFCDKRNEMWLLNQSDNSKLVHLTETSNEKLEDLKKIRSKGEQLLQLTTYCRKLQTEKEKIEPWKGFRTLEEMKDDFSDLGEIESAVKAAEKEDHLKLNDLNFNDLEKFTWRSNRAAVECSDLRIEKQKLEAQNDLLKSKLRQYLATIALSNNSNGMVKTSIDLIPIQQTSVKLKQRIVV